jgi:lipopolysaccharide transport system permease protein
MIALIKEILSRRNLIRELVLKDLKLRYNRPVLGFFWAFILPLVTVVIFYIVFSVFLKAKTEEAPFALYLMSAVFPWGFFCNSVIGSTTCLVDNKNLIRESKFPYYLLPLSIVLANLINFLPSLGILIITAGLVLKGLPLWIMLLPVALLVQILITLGLSVIFSLLYVKYRDLKYVIEILLTIIFNLTPGFYSIYLVKNSLPPIIFKVYLCNPFTGLLIFYRTTILKGFYGFIANETGWLEMVIIPACCSLLILLAATLLYQRKKNNINDYLSY